MAWAELLNSRSQPFWQRVLGVNARRAVALRHGVPPSPTERALIVLSLRDPVRAEEFAKAPRLGIALFEQVRLREGWDTTRAARRWGVCERSYQRWLAGDTLPPRRVQRLLAWYLAGVDWHEIATAEALQQMQPSC